MFLANPAATEDGRYTLDITLDNVGINYAALDFIDVTYRRRIGYGARWPAELYHRDRQ